MTQPLIVLAYEKLLPGSQLVNRLEDQGYRVKSIPDADLLFEVIEKEKPLLLFVDMEPSYEKASKVIARVAGHTSTKHIPIIALTAAGNLPAEQAARDAGARLVVGDSAILAHLEQFLQQALEI